MPTLFFLLLFFSLVCLIVGLIKPSFFSKVFKRTLSRKNILTIFGVAIIIFFVAIGLTAPNIEKQEIADNNIVEKQDESVEDNNIQNSDEDLNEEKNTEDDFAEESQLPTDTTQKESFSEQTTEQPKQTEQTEDNQPVFYSVTKVTDGDTFKIDMNGTIETIRLIGVDTPETVDPRKSVECFGVEASNRAKELLTGKKVRLEADLTQDDRGVYGRLLRYVWLEDGTFFNKEMIIGGYASEYTYKTPYTHQTEFKQAETDARNAKRGLWADGVCVQEESEPVDQAPPITQSSGKYYTSSHYSAIYYYPEACDGWKTLSENYLKIYDSPEALLQVYPTKTLNPQCQ